MKVADPSGYSDRSDVEVPEPLPAPESKAQDYSSEPVTDAVGDTLADITKERDDLRAHVDSLVEQLHEDESIESERDALREQVKDLTDQAQTLKLSVSTLTAANGTLESELKAAHDLLDERASDPSQNETASEVSVGQDAKKSSNFTFAPMDGGTIKPGATIKIDKDQMKTVTADPSHDGELKQK